MRQGLGTRESRSQGSKEVKDQLFTYFISFRNMAGIISLSILYCVKSFFEKYVLFENILVY